MALSKFAKAHHRRGVSLVEVLIAGVVLVIGLTGVTALMNYSFETTRTSVRRLEAAQAGTGAMETLSAQFSGPGAVNRPNGTYDGGTYFSAEGVPLYTRTVTVSALPGIDGGTSTGSLVQLRVTYTNALRQQREQVYTTVVTP